MPLGQQLEQAVYYHKKIQKLLSVWRQLHFHPEYRKWSFRALGFRVLPLSPMADGQGRRRIEYWQPLVIEGVQVAQFSRKEVRMADVQLYYLSKANTHFPSLTSPEQSRTEIAQTLECLNAEYLQLKQSGGKEARLVCDLSHSNLNYEHLQYLTVKLLASPVQLYALDLSRNHIFAATWPEVLPLVKQLLTKAMYVDL
jgi:hypothetical protein